MLLNEQTITNLIVEIKAEQHAAEKDETLKTYIKDAIHNICRDIGFEIDFDEDFKARKLLKNYVFYDRYKRLAEFKIAYAGEYEELREFYYSTNIQ